MGLGSAVGRRHFVSLRWLRRDLCNIDRGGRHWRRLEVMNGECVSESVRLFACSSVNEVLKEWTRIKSCYRSSFEEPNLWYTGI
jgi:hypothetical protein